jgi:cytoskeletal protein RodZ
VSRLAGERTRADHAAEVVETEVAETTEPTVPLAPAARRDPLPPAALLREVRRGLRAEVTREAPATVLGSAALVPDDVDGRTSGLPEREVLLRHGDERDPFGPSHLDHGRVRPIASLGEPVEPLVVEDFVTEPALDPVIGPQLAAARNRVGLSVDELAERTRIRPHVIEAIEVDDFAPCGGDFYARGHLRTLARVLGQDAGPLVEKFDQRYATAPINARTVFEAELATGMTGSMRSTVGGPNWALLAGVVLVLVMVWSVVRLVASEPEEVLRSPVPTLNGSAGVGNGAHGPVVHGAATPKPVRVTLTGAEGDSHVVVRSRGGKVAWAGELVLGEKRVVRAVPPLVVRSSDAGAVSVRVAGKDKGLLGEAGQPGRRTFHRPAASHHR